ncbi:MAG: hypothetical protein E7559_03820 [Ruminococcaceae bacterium]|nr:hypothetical protein [Oscillospiraceae bacterium]
MKRALGVLLALLLVVSIAACSREEENTLPPVASGSAVVVTPEAQIPTNVDPSIKGYITRINYSVESTEILVEYYYDADTEPKYSYDKALVKVDSNTAIATDKGDSVPISSLTVGTVVEAWFTEPSAESYPVLAYGQAIRISTGVSNLSGVLSLPQMYITSGSSAIAVVTKAEWRGSSYTFAPLRTLLDQTTGAHISVSPGDTIALNFSKEPKSVTVTYSNSTLTAGETLAVSEDMKKIIVPEDAKDEIYIRVNAEWNGGSAQYAFSAVIIEAAQAQE